MFTANGMQYYNVDGELAWLKEDKEKYMRSYKDVIKELKKTGQID